MGTEEPLPSDAVFVDKQLDNFQYLGLVAAALPASKIVVLLRDPRDAVLSQFFTRFGPEHDVHAYDWTSDLKVAAEHHVEFLRIVRHWAALLGNQLLLVRYEDLVGSPERTMQRLC